jgi:hypothetical protein
MLRVDAGEVNVALSVAWEPVARADRRALAECLRTCRFHLSVLPSRVGGIASAILERGAKVKTRINGLVVAVALVLLVAGGARMQGQSTSLGVVGGLNVATLSVEDSEGLDIGTRLGFNFGARLSATFTPNLGVLLGAFYSQKGMSTTEQGVNVGLHFDYIDFPLLAQYTLPTSETGKTSVHFAAGPAVGLRVTCKLTGEESGSSVSIDCADVGADIKSVDLGIMALAGLDIQAGSGSVIVDVAYDLGLTDINSTSDGGSIKNRNLYLMAGYQFPLGSR